MQPLWTQKCSSSNVNDCSLKAQCQAKLMGEERLVGRELAFSCLLSIFPSRAATGRQPASNRCLIISYLKIRFIAMNNCAKIREKLSIIVSLSFQLQINLNIAVFLDSGKKLVGLYTLVSCSVKTISNISKRANQSHCFKSSSSRQCRCSVQVTDFLNK